ncbi:MAG: hypothetical protein ACKVQU_01710 [Burkholderiales bacterium]
MNKSCSTRTALTALALAVVFAGSLGLVITTSDRLVALSDHPRAIAIALNVEPS